MKTLLEILTTILLTIVIVIFTAVFYIVADRYLDQQQDGQDLQEQIAKNQAINDCYYISRVINTEKSTTYDYPNKEDLQTCLDSKGY